MKGSANRLISAPAALISKLVGTILILSFLLDTVTLLIPSSPPFSPLDRGWQLSATTQLVERGFIPMLGMALLFLGSWMDERVDGQGSGQPWQLVKLGALVLSGILGLVFLLVAPLHINNVRLASNEGLQRIQQQASQAETQLSSPDFRAQVEQRRTQIKTQIGDLLKDDQRLNQALQSGQVPDQLKNILQQSKDNPRALDDYLEQQAKDFSNQTLTQVRDRKQQLEKQAKMGALKSQVQIGLSSLFLAIGYFIITGTGLSGVLSSPKMGPSKAPKR
ncbi:HpsJ family protein [Argonema galeatum]|uniref:hormogonium polysaccharide biosynthesis protein HpsJ n=1 Tax=Argonema galeatum TaxID=2942762 RepID=UPI0020122ADD|nr:HpsJ family protein [Argonema galeatum]MCL1468195.1 HpsJ family protein [Argonema galeatum A003/A1]